MGDQIETIVVPKKYLVLLNEKDITIEDSKICKLAENYIIRVLEEYGLKYKTTVDYGRNSFNCIFYDNSLIAIVPFTLGTMENVLNTRKIIENPIVEISPVEIHPKYSQSETCGIIEWGDILKKKDEICNEIFVGKNSQ